MNKINAHPTRRGLRRSQRIIHFATKVTIEFDNTIRNQAEEQDCLIVEMLEKYQAIYLKHLDKEGKKEDAKTSKKK